MCKVAYLHLIGLFAECLVIKHDFITLLMTKICTLSFPDKLIIQLTWYIITLRNFFPMK